MEVHVNPAGFGLLFAGAIAEGEPDPDSAKRVVFNDHQGNQLVVGPFSDEGWAEFQRAVEQPAEWVKSRIEASRVQEEAASARSKIIVPQIAERVTQRAQ